jgi:hypothetical protein
MDKVIEIGIDLAMNIVSVEGRMRKAKACLSSL